MTIAALTLFGCYMAVTFGLRTWLQLRATDDTGFRGISGRPGTSEWWAGLLFVLALVAGLMGPVAAMVGLAPVPVLDATIIRAVGTVLALAGVVATFVTQIQMGTSWRIGVDHEERTALVTTGAFALVGNPIFTAMAFTGVGLALMVPNAVALIGVGLLLLALHLQVRVVEEPYLHRVHGRTYEEYAARTGRFLPRLGGAHRSMNTSDNGVA